MPTARLVMRLLDFRVAVVVVARDIDVTRDVIEPVV
jgi:hypothetical protein